jgi:hypothetical protein
MRKDLFRGVVLGSVVATVTMIAASAIAGNGIGAIFNLGQTNRVNTSTLLTGTTAGRMLRVTNSGTGEALGLNVQPGSAPMTVNSTVKVTNLNADKLDGLDAALISHQTTGITTGPVQVLSLGGLVLNLECVNSDFFEPRLTATTIVDDSVFRSRALPDFGADEVIVITDDDFDAGVASEHTLYSGSQGSGLINYRTPAGSNVTVQYMVHGFGTSVGGCMISGTALQSNE